MPRTGGAAMPEVATVRSPATRALGAVRAWSLARLDARCERAVAGRKEALLGRLEGDVLELGPGRGESFAFYPRHVRWSGVEPDASCHPRLLEAARARGISARLVEAKDGRGLAVPDASVDAVVSMFALCTVPDVGRTVDEILRVLRPGGRFAFLEHVGGAPGTLLLGVQRVLDPWWRRFACGCQLTREILPSIEEAGFSRVQVERFTIPVWLLSPHVAGVAIR